MKYFFYPFFRYHQIFIISIMLLFMSMPSITNAQTPLGLRAGLPSFSNFIREHVNSVWETYDPFIRWTAWGTVNYTNLQGQNIEFRNNPDPNNSDPNDSNTVAFKEDVSLTQTWFGGDFHLFQNLLIGVFAGYENATSLLTNQDVSIPQVVSSESESKQNSGGGGIYVGFRFEDSVLSVAGVGMNTTDQERDLESQRMMLTASLTFTRRHPEQDKIRIKGILSGMWAQQFFPDEEDLGGRSGNPLDPFKNIVNGEDEASISFGRIMVGLEMGINLAPLEDDLFEAFLMINGEYNIFGQQDDYNILYPDTEESTFGANIGGGINIHLEERLNVRVIYSYLEILSENFSGHTVSGSVSYKWSETLLFFFSANHRQQSDTVFLTKMQWSF